MPYTTIGEFSLNLNASLCIGSCKITTLSLTETTYMGINSQGTSGEAKLGKKKTVRLHGWPGMKRSWFRGLWFKQECWWNLIILSDALTCILLYFFFRQLARIRTNIVNPGHRTVNAEKIQSTCCSIAPKVAESVQVCMMLKKWNRLPITLQKFAIIDPCNAFFSLSWAYILILLPIHLHQWAFPDFSIIVLFFKKRSSSFPSTPPPLFSTPSPTATST